MEIKKLLFDLVTTMELANDEGDSLSMHSTTQYELNLKSICEEIEKATPMTLTEEYLKAVIKYNDFNFMQGIDRERLEQYFEDDSDLKENITTYIEENCNEGSDEYYVFKEILDKIIS